MPSEDPTDIDIPLVNEKSTAEAYPAKCRRLLREHPEYCSVAEVARTLGITKAGVRHHQRYIKHQVVEGITLFHRGSMTFYAHGYSKRDKATRMSFYGIDVTRLQTICEAYYRVNYDSGPPELLKLAKKVARL